jgi:Family of unknown function (DUF5989)
MSERYPSAEEKDPSDFAKQAAQATPGVIRELFGFLRQSGKWWLVPVLLGLLAIGLLVALAETAVAPFIYALF